ncbi:copper amine oxidase N-terminal domain-containing protein [Paenibacillus zeisoli]|uniref:Copper amine oxidase N-terminal domain-containing protein n=1 Tax=Paenibacillus zeisoli TaxID=2496267 RepID=A0A3S1B8H6_9BACL|nr:copper amine oxidase N-terminal domain-containing protein [Paenibacillus zeisoli]RUT31725.1 copper amine oxidase N-terminal domain-containing protein [Paenibacillus zeisoli]
MKKLLYTFIILGVFSFNASAFAATDIGITVKDKPLKSDSRPILVQGRVMVPLRAVSESLGASVQWNSHNHTATVSKWSETISLTVGKKTARIDGGVRGAESIPLDVPVKTVSNRVYVPLRLISEQYGYKVTWSDHTVSIQSPLTPSGRAKLYKGDLSTSRSIAMDTALFSGAHYEHQPLTISHEQEDYSAAFLFPEGEALRFFMIAGSETITLFEYKDDFLVATWQAHVQKIGQDPLQQLLEDKLKDRTGPTPTIKKPFLYYDSGYFGDASYEEYGRIDKDSKYTRTAYLRKMGGLVTESTGTFTLLLPDEKRKEVITIPKN